MKIEKLAVHDLYILTELFDYNDVEQMISECTRDIQNEIIDIFVLYDKDVLVGELHVMYESDDENYAIRGRRAYLFAFRVRENFQNKGYGTYLLKMVLTVLKENGYSEFTVGVEDDNFRAIHMYQALGFDKFLLRKQEEYQGDAYEYNLFLKRYTIPIWLFD
jgi:ribosomal protein S18 acetylase RimI-like enzyme